MARKRYLAQSLVDPATLEGKVECPYNTFHVHSSNKAAEMKGVRVTKHYSPRRDDPKFVKFLQCLSQGATYKEAMERSKVSWPMVNNLKRKREDFAKALSLALEDREAIWQAMREDVSEERAMSGSVVVHRDKNNNIIRTITAPSDKLLDKKLSAGNKERYMPNSDKGSSVTNILNVNSSGSVGHTLKEILESGRQTALRPPSLSEEVIDVEVDGDR